MAQRISQTQIVSFPVLYCGAWHEQVDSQPYVNLNFDAGTDTVDRTYFYPNYDRRAIMHTQYDLHAVRNGSNIVSFRLTVSLW
jgi:hypothetical protein